MNVVWSPIALERVVGIGEFIAQSRPQAAANVVERLFDSVLRLAEFPESGRHLPESPRADLREVIHGNYRVIYRLDPHEVVILTVRHARQHLSADDPDLS